MIPPLLPNGEVYTSDVLNSIAKELRELATNTGAYARQLRPPRLRKLADQIEALAQSIDGQAGKKAAEEAA